VWSPGWRLRDGSGVGETAGAEGVVTVAARDGLALCSGVAADGAAATAGVARWRGVRIGEATTGVKVGVAGVTDRGAAVAVPLAAAW
jgi:hypothetical protein